MPDSFAPIRAALARPGRSSSDSELNPGTRPPGSRSPRPAAVLIALEDAPDGSGLRLHLTKRSSLLRHHPGQIAFPGGKVEPEDSDCIVTALREAREEIALDAQNVEVLSVLSPHETVTGFTITPVLGRVREPFALRPQPGEVEEAFTVPFAHLCDLSSYRIERRRWRGSWRHYYVAPYGPYYIWGATAGILYRLAQRIAGSF